MCNYESLGDQSKCPDYRRCPHFSRIAQIKWLSIHFNYKGNIKYSPIDNMLRLTHLLFSMTNLTFKIASNIFKVENYHIANCYWCIYPLYYRINRISDFIIVVLYFEHAFFCGHYGIVRCMFFRGFVSRMDCGRIIHFILCVCNKQNKSEWNWNSSIFMKEMNVQVQN